MSDADVATKSAMLEMTYKRLAKDPDTYQRELTVGFMRMLDEARLEARAKNWGGNRDVAYYSDPYWSELHPGEVLLLPTEVMDLRLTIRFHLWAKNPYRGGWETDTFDIMFKRDQAGRIVLLDRDHNKEWLTSYYTGEGRDHTDEERDKYARLGAEKLYQALKSKTVKNTRVTDLSDLP